MAAATSTAYAFICYRWMHFFFTPSWAHYVACPCCGSAGERLQFVIGVEA